ncbi:molybdopterin biosynthesis protein [Halovenus carboxidivorans]|uniref:molybdopterin biosynthesis protein n=1 Tax=Halovenus carboxidivorans TaxID=2692199 RepID=UPI0034A32B1A
MVAVRKQFRDLADPEDVHALIAELEINTGTETVPLAQARGRVLAERIDAGIDVPGFDRSNVDGYAVRAEDTFGATEADPVELEQVGRVDAGEQPAVTVEPGTVVEIATGAVVPPGADAVVMVERTAREDETVTVRTAVAPGDGIMVAGSDVAAGERTLGPGTELTAREIGLLSALGVDSVPVRSPPTVGVLSTGDELVAPGNALDSDAGQIYDVNSQTIAASIEEAGGSPEVYPIVGDDFPEMKRVLTAAAEECDLVLSSGSTSAGAADHIYQLIDEHGDLLRHGVAVKPGKPMLVGRFENTPYIGLPGFPVSALTIFRHFVAPKIRDAAGKPPRERERITGEMAVTERYKEGRTRLMPVGLVEDGDGELLVYPVDKGSGATTSLVDADGTVELAPETEQLDAGQTVEVTLFSADVRPPELLGIGEDDPLLSRLLDRLDSPRYLSLGSREGLRRLRNGISDVAVVAGPTDREVETVELGGWSREWGLLVPADNPDGVAGVADLVDSELRFVNRGRQSGLRRSFDDAVERLADERGTDRASLTEDISGYTLTAQAYESPPRRVLAGKADVALGLRASAEPLGLAFVSLGTQSVRVLAAPDRAEKPGVEALEALLPPADLADGLAGIEAGEH